MLTLTLKSLLMIIWIWEMMNMNLYMEVKETNLGQMEEGIRILAMVEFSIIERSRDFMHHNDSS